MKKVFASIIYAVAVLAPSAQCQEIPIANGSSSGTYKAFMAEIQAVTKDSGLQFKEIESHGSVENLDLLVTNKVAMAFMHADVPYFRGQREDLTRFKTLLALFKEEVHFLAPRNTKRAPTTTGGNVFGFGKTTTPAKEITSIEDLKGLTVGASGGGAITAQVINSIGGIGYNFKQFEKGDAVMAALDSGEIDAAVFVGGAPLPNLTTLDNRYKLLPIGASAPALKQVYSPATVTYPKMSPEGIPTIATDCVLLTREYKSPKMIEMLATFRKAFYEHLLELQETPGIHPKWQEVTPDSRGKWPFLEIAGSMPAPSPAIAPAPIK